MHGLAENQISLTAAPVGRPRINHDKMPARFPAGTFARIDASLRDGETRTDVLRLALESELKRRGT